MPPRHAPQPPAEPIRLVVVESRPLLGIGVREVLDREPDIEVVAAVSSPEEALRVADEAAPDVILVDSRLAEAADVEAARSLHRGTPESAMVVLGGDTDAARTVGALQAGAVAHIAEVAQPAELVDTIRRVADGGDPLKEGLASDPELVGRVVEAIRDEALAAPPPSPLTPREQEILEHVAAGHRNREIAGALDVSEQTVKNHLGSVLHKLGVRDRRSAARLAGRHGWLVLPGGALDASEEAAAGTAGPDTA